MKKAPKVGDHVRCARRVRQGIYGTVARIFTSGDAAEIDWLAGGHDTVGFEEMEVAHFAAVGVDTITMTPELAGALRHAQVCVESCRSHASFTDASESTQAMYARTLAQLRPVSEQRRDEDGRAGVEGLDNY